MHNRRAARMIAVVSTGIMQSTPPGVPTAWARAFAVAYDPCLWWAERAFEHVRSDSPALAAWQTRLAEPWRRFARGWRCDRPTPQLIASSGLTLGDIHEQSGRAMPAIVRPLVVGRSRREQR